VFSELSCAFCDSVDVRTNRRPPARQRRGESTINPNDPRARRGRFRAMIARSEMRNPGRRRHCRVSGQRTARCMRFATLPGREIAARITVWWHRAPGSVRCLYPRTRQPRVPRARIHLPWSLSTPKTRYLIPCKAYVPIRDGRRNGAMGWQRIVLIRSLLNALPRKCGANSSTGGTATLFWRPAQRRQTSWATGYTGTGSRRALAQGSE
jgi:hypothetical protein